MSDRLSATMAIMLAETIEHGGELVRYAMGKWSYPGCPRGRWNTPEWYVSASTVEALVRRNQLEYVQHSKGSRKQPIRAQVVKAVLQGIEDAA